MAQLVIPQLVRQNTTTFAKMLPKASSFNDVINLKKGQWDRFISGLNDNIISAALDITNPFNNFIDKCEATQHKIEANGTQTITINNNFPKVFMLGGSAFSAYGKYFENLGHSSMEMNAPRTHDWDIVISLNQEITEPIIELIREGLIKFIKQNINTVIDPSYLVHFEDIQQVEEEKEHTIYIHSTNKIEVTILRNKKYINFRINMALNIEGTYVKDHLVEFVLWPNTSQFNKGITKINYLSTNNGLNYAVPIVRDLVLLTTRAIINRSLIPHIMAKCRQDYARLKYLCEALILGGESLASFNTGNICNIASQITGMLQQCSLNLSDENFSALQQEMLQPETQIKLTKNKEDIEQMLRTHLNESETILFFKNISSYETKYLKYKQKYLALKKAFIKKINK